MYLYMPGLLQNPGQKFCETYYNYHAGIPPSEIITSSCDISLSRVHEFTGKDHKVTIHKGVGDVSYFYLSFDGGTDCPVEVLYTIKSTDIVNDFSIKDRPPGFRLENAIPTAQRWIKECLDGHETHPKDTQPRSYPTRLLKIQESSVRLVLPAGEDVSGPYAALSYCWGPNPSFLRLSASNLQTLRDGIPHSSLPLAFQEAIRVMRTIGIQYLWIHAFCIINTGPGSDEDWKSEAMKMQEVYSNCLVNFTLSTAPNLDHSCLECHHDTEKKEVRPFQAHVNPNDGDNRDAGPEDWVIRPSWYYSRGIQCQPLGKRAWALQEWFLVPRVVSLGRGGLFWDCNQIPSASETFPCGSLVGKAGYQDLESIWLSFLDKYSNFDLTYPDKDKLIAFSAIASKMGQAMNDVYIAVEDHNSAAQIIKRIPSEICEEERKKQNRTPTWSWASIDGPVLGGLYMYSHDPTGIAEAKSYELTLLDDSHPYEAVVYASLRIEAFCKEIELVTKQFNYPHLDARFEILDEMPIKGHCVLLAALIHFNLGGEECAEGLILRKKGTAGEEMYARIGIFLLRLDKKSTLANIFEQ
ncbi:heterokaryon incompatibility protein-domain-containing protein [Aspergillus pseudocaelatus]|uniref:Heterokaryon incompatibility protein-domain-containing protein n=1 Tax=Aspergillus pseudocaelatus TaxID=1825620 RepID=A0ABQ6WTJ3_9EURO|nr:heterokaryon incompatibility protein-domain-containing protein [Aspergillus pseudocaelatus]